MLDGGLRAGRVVRCFASEKAYIKFEVNTKRFLNKNLTFILQ